MFSLSSGQYIEAQSSTTNISYVVSGTTYSGAVASSGVLSEGFFMPKKKFFTATYRSDVSILFANTNQNTDSVLTVWVQGSKIFSGTLSAGGSASFDGEWKVYNSNGVQVLDSGFEHITVSENAPSNPSIGDLWIDIS